MKEGFPHMKRMLSLILALLLALGTLSALAEASPARETVDLPAVGDVVYGFKALEIREFPLIGAQIVLFEHEKTGAKLTYVAKDDTNRAFQLTFATRPTNNTGLPHVFEHATLSGSEKYPSAALFMNLLYQTYNTYMNAYTTDAMTCYPVASLSEEQLLKYADYYTDSCLHPSILTDESIFRTEAWRYRMASMDDDLTLEGTVYSEMLGSYTLARAAMLNANREAFPGAAITLDYGGVPDDIPDMTWDDLKAYHDLYYHPSNCMAYLYGQFSDYTAFLALLDSAFAPYEKADFHFEDASYARISAPSETYVPYPMAAGTDTENQAQVYYYIVCPGMKDDVEQENIIDNLCSLLNASSSLLMQNLKKALPAASFSFGRELAAPDDAILFEAVNVNKEDAKLFKDTVDASLKEIAEAGFPQDMVDSITFTLSMSTKLASEETDPVNNVLHSMAYYYVTTGDPFKYLDSVDKLYSIDEMHQQGLYQQAISQWLLDPALYTLTTTYPEPGAQELKDAALAESLAEKKAAMSEEELQAIIDATNNPVQDDDASALVAQLQAVTVESLPEEVKIYDVSDVTGEDGIRRIDVTAGVDGVGVAQIYLDAQGVPQEDLHWFRLFTRLLGQLDTAEHTKEELDVLTTRYLYDKTIGIDMCGQPDGSYHPRLILEWTAMDEDLATGYDLMNELLFSTQFTDAQKLLEKVQAQKASVRNTINSNAYSIMLYRGLAVDIPMYRFYSYINFLEYYDFLNELEVMLAEDPAAVTQRFEALQSAFANNSGAICAFAGNEASIQANHALADQFLAKLGTADIVPQAYDLPVPSMREALIIDGNIQYNNVIASYDKLGLEDFDASLNVISTLVTDQLLTPILRDTYGVYTPWHGATQDGGVYLISYRDPNITETFDVYAALPKMVSQLEVDQETLDGYILNNYSSLAAGSGELSGAVSAISYVLGNVSQEEPLEYMRQLKSVTPDKVREAAALYQAAWDNGVHSTAGSMAAISAHTDLYDVILNPFNANDPTQVELTDVPKDSEIYDAVRFVFESGMMQPLTADTFGVDENATVGDFLGALFTLMGGPVNDPEGARGWLAGYGLVEEDQDLDADLTEELLCFVLVNGLGVGLSTDTPDAAVSRGDLADLMYQINMMMSAAE